MLKTALVTGGSRGIGEAVVRLLAADGYGLAFTYLNHQEEALKIAQDTGAIPLRCDVSSAADCQMTVGEACKALGRIDVLVNNAGVAQAKGLLTDTTIEEWRHLFAVHVEGTFSMTKAVLPGMVRGKYGSIVNLSSIWGQTGASCEVAYSAAKAAVIGMTRALAKEVGPSGIRVNCVAPGVIDTSMNADLSKESLAELLEQTPLGTLGSPWDVAQCVLFLASHRAGFITGQVFSPNGGMYL